MSIDHSGPCNALAGKRTYTVEEIAKILGIGRTAASVQDGTDWLVD